MDFTSNEGAFLHLLREQSKSHYTTHNEVRLKVKESQRQYVIAFVIYVTNTGQLRELEQTVDLLRSIKLYQAHYTLRRRPVLFCDRKTHKLRYGGTLHDADRVGLPPPP